MADRYGRQKAVEGIGDEGQARIAAGRVLVVGCGALGSVVAMYLVGAGVGRIGIVDYDTIDITNLQRQVFYSEALLGKKKVEELGRAMRALNPEVEVREYEKCLTPKNGPEILAEGEYSLLVDATDNPASKLGSDLLAEVACIPCVIGGVMGLHGQVITILPGGVRYRELFPDLPTACGLTPCQTLGVLGPTAGTVASIQATEVLKLLAGLPTLAGYLLDIDLLSNTFRAFQL